MDVANYCVGQRQIPSSAMAKSCPPVPTYPPAVLRSYSKPEKTVYERPFLGTGDESSCQESGVLASRAHCPSNTATVMGSASGRVGAAGAKLGTS